MLDPGDFRALVIRREWKAGTGSRPQMANSEPAGLQLATTAIHPGADAEA